MSHSPCPTCCDIYAEQLTVTFMLNNDNCWDHGTTNIFDLTRNFIRDLLRSAHFRVLLPPQTNCRLSTSALHLQRLLCTSRPDRERPQFIAGDDPPLIYN